MPKIKKVYMELNNYKDLLKKASEVSKNAYAPYSKFKVGAVVVFESKKEYLGCNVENTSYGLSLCAERNAIASAIADGENTKIKYIAVFSPNQKKCMPCGACRQWIYEFSAKDTKIVLENNDKEPLVLSLEEVFPNAFSIEG